MEEVLGRSGLVVSDSSPNLLCGLLISGVYLKKISSDYLADSVNNLYIYSDSAFLIIF